MSVLKTTIKDGALKEHYQKGALRLISLPVDYGKARDEDDNRFFAYLSTLGGGLVGGDNYSQNFKMENSNAVLSSQSNQKVYKGASKLKTLINLDERSKLLFYNHANIFYKDADFSSKTTIFCQSGAQLFYLDGGFIGYADACFKANMSLRIYINSSLKLNDLFHYDSRQNLNSFFNYEYFYTLVIVNEELDIPDVDESDLKAFSSKIDKVTVLRVVSSKNDSAMNYIDELKNQFLKENV